MRPDAPEWRDQPLSDGIVRACVLDGRRADSPDADGPAATFTVAVCTYRRAASVARFLGSMVGQARAAALLLVDASDDDETERAVRAHPDRARLADRVEYVRVAAARRGVTRQRNFALARVATPLVAFFDDDVVLRPGCLAALVDAHARGGPTLAGVGAAIEDEPARPSVWRARRLLGIVPSLVPGRYHGSGVSTPWGFVPPGSGTLDGDWLPGGATMWKTAAARAVGFDEGLGGYGCGNDLAFSLAIAAHGRQQLSAAARVRHLHAPAGRPDVRAMAREAMQSVHAIHRAFANRDVLTRLWFAYAVAADTALAATGLVRRRRARAAAAHLRGVADYWLGGSDRATLSATRRGA